MLHGFGVAADQIPPALFHRGEKLVFVDLKQVTSTLSINAADRSVKVMSALTFETRERGRPLIMLPHLAENLSAHQENADLVIQKVSAEPASPLASIGENLFYLEELRPGTHKLNLSYELPEGKGNLIFNRQKDVDFFLAMSDSRVPEPQVFLDSTFPTNLIFDQYKFDLTIQVFDSSATYDLLANGQIKRIGPNRFRVHFPDWYTSASFFLHLYKKDSVDVLRTTFTLSDKRSLPVEVECEKNKIQICRQTSDKLQSYLRKYESRLGPYPHSRLVVRICPAGTCNSMEYSGALVSRYSEREAVVLNLEHEMLHSWFARSVQFRSGGDSWLDEALVVWLFTSNWPPLIADRAVVDRLCETSTYPYAQYTSGEAYGLGPQVLEQLHQDLLGEGGLEPVLRRLHRKYKHSVISQTEFFRFIAKASREVSVRLKLRSDLQAWLP